MVDAGSVSVERGGLGTAYAKTVGVNGVTGTWLRGISTPRVTWRYTHASRRSSTSSSRSTIVEYRRTSNPVIPVLSRPFAMRSWWAFIESGMPSKIRTIS